MKKLQTFIFILFSLHLSAQDNTPPEIVSFSLSPQVIDVTGGPQAVTFTVGATDDISGITNITIFIDLPDGNGTSASNETLISGTIQDGVWELDETFSEFTDPGTASISMIWFFDVAGNISSYDDVDLQNLGFDLDFEIINNNPPDDTPPEIVSFELMPQIIDVSSGPQTVTFNVGATDDISGVNSITIFIDLPDGNGTSASNETLISGTIQDGVWELDETFSEFTDPGIASVSMIWFFDVAGNISSYDDVELQNLGFDLDFEIVNDNAPDSEAPEIVSFDFSPQVIDVSDGPQGVVFTVGATDNISGVINITIFIDLPDGNGTSTSNEVLISGTIQDGVWDLDKSFSEFTFPGIATISMIWFFDNAGNISSYEDIALLDLGFDIDFEIINNNALPVEWYQQLKVDNRHKLTWAVSQQINNSHFEIEHSLDGHSYTVLDKIEGEGNSNSTIHYEYIHKDPSPGINYYRIKQMDYDGQYSYSNVASSLFKNGESNIYPNPIIDRFFINYPRKGKVIIYNQQGDKLKEVNLDQDLTEIDLSEMTSGIYMVKFEDGSVRRIVKI